MSVMYRELKPEEFEKALAIRIKVFVEEQNVPLEEEHDAYDETATHFGVFIDQLLVGTGRLVLQNDTGKIGRIAILPDYRGKGLGSGLIRSIIALGQDRGLEKFVLGAQLQALKFYQNLGFEAEGDVFQDGGLPHKTMRWQKS